MESSKSVAAETFVVRDVRAFPVSPSDPLLRTQTETIQFFSTPRSEPNIEGWFDELTDAVRRHLVVILVLEAVVLDILALPTRLSFESHLLRDPAETLGLHYLLTHGYRINQDFGYQYGLLNLLVGKCWFALFPANNLSIQPIFIAISAWLTVGLAKFAKSVRAGLPGILLLMVSLPFAIQPENTWFSLEGAFLTNALAEQAAGRRGNALALVTASCLVMPRMGYLYGFLLLSIIAMNLYRHRAFTLKRLVEMLLPAAVAGAALILLLSLTFGTYSVASTLLPLRGMETYRQLHFGLFQGSLTSFLYFPGVRLGYYFGTPCMFWLLGTLVLTALGIKAGVEQLVPRARSFRAAATSEMVSTCAVLHLVFIAGFYGPPSSWTYYAYILVAGLVAVTRWSGVCSAVAVALALVAVVGNFSVARNCYRGWRLARPTADTANLWAFSDERREWLSVERLIAGKRATLLVPVCGGELLSTSLEPPVAAFLVPGNSVEREIDRKARQTSEADIVVRPNTLAFGADADQPLVWWPQLRSAMSRFKLVWSGKYFQVYEKTVFAPQLR